MSDLIKKVKVEKEPKLRHSPSAILSVNTMSDNRTIGIMIASETGHLVELYMSPSQRDCLVKELLDPPPIPEMSVSIGRKQ